MFSSELSVFIRFNKTTAVHSLRSFLFDKLRQRGIALWDPDLISKKPRSGAADILGESVYELRIVPPPLRG